MAMQHKLAICTCHRRQSIHMLLSCVAQPVVECLIELYEDR